MVSPPLVVRAFFCPRFKIAVGYSVATPNDDWLFGCNSQTKLFIDVVEAVYNQPSWLQTHIVVGYSVRTPI